MKDITLYEDELRIFDYYFAGVVSMAHCHPGNGRSNGYGVAPPMKSIEECADVVLDMIMVRRQLAFFPDYVAGPE